VGREGAEFVPEYYTLRHGGHKDESPLTDWELQARRRVLFLLISTL
jgi:hypothetical protein